VSGLGPILGGISGIATILDKIEWLYKTVLKLFQKSPVEELAKKERKSDEGQRKADQKDDTSDII